MCSERAPAKDIVASERAIVPQVKPRKIYRSLRSEGYVSEFIPVGIETGQALEGTRYRLEHAAERSGFRLKLLCLQRSVLEQDCLGLHHPAEQVSASGR